MSVSDCCWHWQDTVLAAGCQRVISIYLLPIPRMPQSTCCELRFIQLVTLSLFLSLSIIHCYTLRTSGTCYTPSPLSAFVRTGPYPSVPTSFMMTPFSHIFSGVCQAADCVICWFPSISHSCRTVSRVWCVETGGGVYSAGARAGTVLRQLRERHDVHRWRPERSSAVVSALSCWAKSARCRPSIGRFIMSSCRVLV